MSCFLSWCPSSSRQLLMTDVITAAFLLSHHRERQHWLHHRPRAPAFTVSHTLVSEQQYGVKIHISN